MAPIFISVSYDFLLIGIGILFCLFYPTRLYGLMDTRFYMIPRTFRLFKCPFFVAVWSLVLLWSSFSSVRIKLTRLCYELAFARIICRSTSSQFIRVALMYHGSRFEYFFGVFPLLPVPFQKFIEFFLFFLQLNSVGSKSHVDFFLT
jgi:hypothetical protein